MLREEVALKELIPALVGDETLLKRFLAEAKATIRLRHERIVATHAVFAERGNYYIVMEHMAGGKLEERLRERGALPVDEAIRIAADVAEGLAYAHAHGVVHCDLKPDNVLFTADPLRGAGAHAKIADFGIAHVPREMFSRSWVTAAGFVAGTLPYMSPEQADGVRDDPRADLYALGAVLYRMLTGRTYLEFDERNTPGAQARNVGRIQTEQPQPPSVYNRRVPPWLDAVVLRALAKRPDDRYANAGEMLAALTRRAAAPAPGPAPAQPEAETVVVPPSVGAHGDAPPHTPPRADRNVNDGYQFTAPVGSYPKGASPYGALDIAGNVWEWVADWYDEKYYASSPTRNPPGPASGQYRVLRGGSWNDLQGYVRAADRGRYEPDGRFVNLGFRCARSP